jgi:ACS family hexuronate transporter-like MFS transporter
MSEQHSQHRRFQISLLVLLFWIALINYFDRQSLSVVAPYFQLELHLSDTGYGHIVTAFLFASAIAYALTGFLSDRLGTRLSMALFVGWWSVAEALTAFAHTAAMLASTRFMLGLGEPGLWVAAPKAVGEFFEKEKRAAAIGYYTLGAMVGAVVALPVIVAVTTHLHWRTIFLLDGISGLLWLPLWFLCLGGCGRRSSIPAIQLSSTETGGRSRVAKSSDLRAVLSCRRTWQLLIARGLTDPVWYFYLFWFPKFLASALHLSLPQIARTGWWVYLAAGVGTIVGGVLAGSWIKRGYSPALVYRTIMACCAILVPLSPLATLQESPALSISIASIVAFAHMCWLINLGALVVELFSLSQVATAFGLIAAGSAFGGMLFSEIIGYVVTHYGYSPLFWIMACAHPLALAVMWSTAKPASQVSPFSLSPSERQW